MLTGNQRKFCEAYVVALNGTDAYTTAYPRCSRTNARGEASRLLKRPPIVAEIQRLRDEADRCAGSAVLQLVEKRAFLARVVRANGVTLDLAKDGDLIVALDRREGTDGADGVLKIRLADKLAAIKLDNDLAGDGAEAGSSDALGALLSRLMR